MELSRYQIQNFLVDSSVLRQELSQIHQTPTASDNLWAINLLPRSQPFPNSYVGTNLTPESFLARLLSVSVFYFLCIAMTVVLAHHPSCIFLFLGFSIQEEQSLLRDFTAILCFPLSCDPAAFFKFKSLGRPFEMLRQDNILYKGEKATEIREPSRYHRKKKSDDSDRSQKDKRQYIKSLVSQLKHQAATCSQRFAHSKGNCCFLIPKGTPKLL